MTPIDGPELVRAVMVVSDFSIACAYYAIPAAIVAALVRYKTLPFRWILWLFVSFIMACGTTHLMSVVQAFTPLPVLAALVEMVTAMISGLTAILLWVFLDQCEKALVHPLSVSHE